MELLKVEDLNISVAKESVISNASFRVNTGDVVLLTGPNGCGKSTIIKLIMGDIFDYSDIICSSSVIRYKGEYDILRSETESEEFRKHVCYISQEDVFESDSVLDCFLMSLNFEGIKNKERYIFDFIMRYGIQNCYGINSTILDRMSNAIIRRLKLRKDELDDEMIRAVKLLAMKIKNMSGGQKKLTNIFTNIIRYEFCDLVFIDEPLNNLDYSNVRAFSNILTRIFREKPKLGIVIVTHCRSLPIVNRLIEIDSSTKSIKEGNNYACSSCFGEIDEYGFYV